ncbi:MAG: spore germination protein [Eubacteriales bacterium]|nr:spore germination protein [Eubacteriales bacterium]
MPKRKRRLVTRQLSEILREAQQKRNAAEDESTVSADEAVNETYHYDQLDQMPLSASLAQNIAVLKRVFVDSPGFNVREFLIAGKIPAAAAFVEGMVDTLLVSANILRPLMHYTRDEPVPQGKGLLEIVQFAGITTAAVRTRDTIGEIVRDVLEGGVVLLLDQESRALSTEVAWFQTRSIEEPVSESVVRGPREGFTESLADGLSLVQRRLKSPNLAVENHFLGRETHTQVSVLYIKGLVNPEHLAELNRRLKRISNNIDGVLESSYLEEMIADQPLSPFPQALNTERPDRVAAALLEGRIAILLENTPFALVVPFEFQALMHASEDYYQNYWFATAIRILRYVSLIIALIGPAVYVAITTFHQEMLPEALLFQVVAARQGVPFPAVIEMLLIDYAFELLREAGIRLPRPVGQAVSIIGALVIGQAAIQAGLTSPLAVIIVAITGIASFVVPAFSMAFTLRLIRFPLTILGGILGLYGVIAGVLAIVIHMAGLRTLGLPYFGGFAPQHVSDLKDSIVRFPWWAMRGRPHELSKRNQQRQTPDLKPRPEGGR